MTTFLIVMLVTVITVLAVSLLFGMSTEYLHYKCISLESKGAGDSLGTNIACTLQGLSFLLFILVHVLALVITFCACRTVTGTFIGWITLSVLVYAGIFITGLTAGLWSLRHYKKKYNN